MFKTIPFALLLACPNASACADSLTRVEVSVAQSKAYLCDQGKMTREFRVALGSGGIDKKVEGDARTPLGRYEFGPPRPSDHYITFIPIGYPTEQQRAQGLTGSDVGLHGPVHYLKWLGWLNTLVNWTAGCIAVGSESEISEIAAWVNDHHVSEIFIY